MRVDKGGVLWFACLISIYSPPRYLYRKSPFCGLAKVPQSFDSSPKTSQHWHKLHPCAYCYRKSLACPTIYLVLVKKLPLFMDSKKSLVCLRTVTESPLQLVLASRVCVLFHKVIFDLAYDVRKLPLLWTPKTK